jgi:hypothetical protein
MVCFPYGRTVTLIHPPDVAAATHDRHDRHRSELTGAPFVEATSTADKFRALQEEGE